MSYDYTEFTQSTSSDAMAEVSRLAEEQQDAEIAVALAEKALSEAKQHLSDIAERRLPDLMDEVGISECKTSSGVVVNIIDEIHANIPKDRFFEALAWLREHNHEGLIKRTVAVAFGKGGDRKAAELMSELERSGMHPEDRSTVHHQTLSAWAREAIREGREIPQELLGVRRVRTAKVGI
jgi:hypothetical protein